MKRLNRILLPALAVALLLSAASMQAQHRGGRGGHGVVIIGGGWGGWGWGWGWPGWYGYPGYYGYGPAYGPRSQWAVIKTDISPEEAYAYLDGRYIGTADDFDGWPDYLYLGPGHYKIEFRLEGFQSITKEVDAKPGMYLDFKDKLQKIPGAKQHGSYETPKLEGGIKRFFAKRRGANVAVDPSAPPEPSTYVGSEDSPSDDGYQAAPEPKAQRDQYGEPRQGGRDERRKARTHLRLTIEPSDAAVYVDNRFVGTAEEVDSLEQGVSISPGRHTVTISRPGYREKTSEIEVREGETGQLEVSLSR